MWKSKEQLYFQMWPLMQIMNEIHVLQFWVDNINYGRQIFRYMEHIYCFFLNLIWCLQLPPNVMENFSLYHYFE